MTYSEPPLIVPRSAPAGHRRFRRWLVRRARQLIVVAALIAGILVLVACGVALRRATCLIGLPDVGHPFDVAAFRAIRLSDNQNAFAGFRQAADKFRRMPRLSAAARQAGPTVGWAQADPTLHAWVEVNREALALFRQAALRADGVSPTLRDPLPASLSDPNLGEFVWLAFLDSAKLEDHGNMKGAWDGYRAILCTKAHLMRRGTVLDRYIAYHFSRGLEPRIAAWAGNPRTDALLIQHALNQVRMLEPKREWDAYSLELDYLRMMSVLEQPDGWAANGSAEDESIRVGGEPLPPNLASSVHAARRFLANEPERSRRVLRLAFANWLSHVDDEDPSRRKPALRAGFSCLKQTTHLPFFTTAPSAPAVASALAPRDLASWLFSTRDAKVLLTHWAWPAVRNLEKREHRALVVLLAEQLYHREHGSPPPSEEALVGPYLDYLPDDSLSDLDDGAAPTIDESTLSGPGQPR